MAIVLCPGFHPPDLTDQFGAALVSALASARGTAVEQPLIFPAAPTAAYAGLQVLQFVQQHLPADAALTLIGFSAGGMGAVTAAHLWQQQGGTIDLLIAIDGWGVPLWGNFPQHRISHDWFTAASSALLGGTSSFYADPPVAHLDLWRSPQTAVGWGQRTTDQPAQRTTALQWLTALLAPR